MTFDEFLRKHGACKEALEWKGTRNLHDAWNECTRLDLMLWLLIRLRLDKRTMRLLACDFVRHTPIGESRTVWDMLTDERAKRAVEIAERYAVFDATEYELTHAALAARESSRAEAQSESVHWARYASWAAAHDVAVAALTVSSTFTIRAAQSAFPADLVRKYFRSRAESTQCDLIRKRISWMDVQRMLEEVE